MSNDDTIRSKMFDITSFLQTCNDNNSDKPNSDRPHGPLSSNSSNPKK